MNNKIIKKILSSHIPYLKIYMIVVKKKNLELKDFSYHAITYKGPYNSLVIIFRLDHSFLTILFKGYNFNL